MEVPRYTRLLTLIVTANALLVLPLLGTVTLWNVDEGRIAEITREMVESGDWIVPRLGGEPFGSYPPLAYWLMALSGLVFGMNEFAMRLPSALAGIALIAVVAGIARRLAGERAGLASALVLTTTPGFLGQQFFCRADMMTALAAVVAFDRFLVVAAGGARARHLMVLYAALALGLLAKGPLVIVVAGLGMAAWLACHRRWSVLADLKPWYGVPAMLALVAPWYVAVYHAAGWEFLRLNLLLENVNAFTRGFEHPRPFWYYAAAGSYRVLPWALFLLFAWPVRRTPGLKMTLGWAGLVLLFLTLSSSKRANYLTYLYPAFAVATGTTLAALWREAPRLATKGLSIPGGAMPAAALVAGFAPVHWRGDLPALAPILPVLAVLVIAAGLVLLAVGWKAGPVAGALTLAAILAGGGLVERLLVEPHVDRPGRDGAAFCRRAAAAVPPGQALACVAPEGVEGSYHFYAARTLPKAGAAPGYYLATAQQRERLAATGRRVQTLDSFQDERNRPKFFLRVHP